jgi:hypothetical protein
MQDEIITVTNTESGQTMDVVVLNKHVNKITVVIGKGIHNVQCDLIPTKYKQSYAGSVMGREIIYHRSCEQVQADLDFVNPALKVSRKFKK